ncbi:MAG: hypothetical protein IMY84_01505 [Chloroflexi bacterium]|nr:hypothetical protein [Chloroflexota bacterium]
MPRGAERPQRSMRASDEEWTTIEEGARLSDQPATTWLREAGIEAAKVEKASHGLDPEAPVPAEFWEGLES